MGGGKPSPQDGRTDFRPNLTGVSRCLDPRARAGASSDGRPQRSQCGVGRPGALDAAFVGALLPFLCPLPGPSPAWGQQRPPGPAAEALGPPSPPWAQFRLLIRRHQVIGGERGPFPFPICSVQGPYQPFAERTLRCSPARGAEAIISSPLGSGGHRGRWASRGPSP